MSELAAEYSDDEASKSNNGWWTPFPIPNAGP